MHLVARVLVWVPIAVALCIAASPDAHAADAISLRWSAPAGCPTADDVLAEMKRLVGPRASADQSPLDVVAEVQRSEDGTYRVRLEIPGEDGPRSREVSAASCAALGQASALILAMMIDPESALSASPRQAQPGQTKPEPPKPLTLSAPLSSLPISLQRPLIKLSASSPVVKRLATRKWPPLSANLNVLLDVGSLPAPSFGFGRGISISWWRLRFELGAAAFPPRTMRFAALASAGTMADLLLSYTSVSTPLAISPKIELWPAVRFELGRLHAASFGVSEPGEGAAIFAGIGIGGRVSVRLTRRTYSVLGLDGIVPITRPTFVVNGVGDALTPAPVVVRLATGFEWRF